MKCPYCGSEILEGLVICTNCGSTINSNLQSENNTNQQVTNTYENQNATGIPMSEQIEKKYDKVNLGICLISFIPLIGIIYFFINRKAYPKKSKAAIICAAVGFVLPYVAYFVFGIISMIMQQ